MTLQQPQSQPQLVHRISTTGDQTGIRTFRCWDPSNPHQLSFDGFAEKRKNVSNSSFSHIVMSSTIPLRSCGLSVWTDHNSILDNIKNRRCNRIIETDLSHPAKGKKIWRDQITKQKYRVFHCFAAQLSDLLTVLPSFGFIQDNNPQGHGTLFPKVDIIFDNFDDVEYVGQVNALTPQQPQLWTLCSIHLQASPVSPFIRPHKDPDVNTAIYALDQLFLSSENEEEIEEAYFLCSLLCKLPPDETLVYWFQKTEKNICHRLLGLLRQAILSDTSEEDSITIGALQNNLKQYISH